MVCWNILKIVARRALQSWSENQTFAMLFFLNDVVYILLPGATGDISLAAGDN